MKFPNFHEKNHWNMTATTKRMATIPISIIGSRERERERERERKTQQLGLNHGKTDVIGWISQIPRTTMMSMTQRIIH